MKPLVFDLFCGLGGWSEAFIAQGYRAVGFDVEAHDYGKGGYPGELVVRDVRSLTGAEMVREYGVPEVIVASPPCQEFSYMAMPWTKAKEKEKKIQSDPVERKKLTDLFNQCFRIQREVSEAAGHYVPLIIENVKGAQKWVGKARWNFGSFYLWGDIPALMPIPGKMFKCAPFPKDASHSTWLTEPRGEGNKTAGMNWSDQTKRGQDFTRVAGMQNEGVKFSQSGADWFDGTPRDKMLGNKGPAAFASKSSKRKKASALIAKIPASLAEWVAKCFKPSNCPK